ncbi:MAG: FG-GAP repeat protein [Planctomycetes bacterium]|nr:FG-GAP repeat protein [Planctomycetota bacterium]
MCLGDLVQDGQGPFQDRGHPCGRRLRRFVRRGRRRERRRAARFRGGGNRDAQHSARLCGRAERSPVYVSNGYSRVASGKDGSTLLEVHNAWGRSRAAECVAGAGDVNGDGVPDLLVGDVESQMVVGVRSEFPHSRGVVRVLSGVDGALIHILTSPARGRVDMFGAALAALGDIDGDGYADFAVSAPLGWPTWEPDQKWPGTGAVFVFSGRTALCLHVIQSDNTGELFGWTIAAAKHPTVEGSALLAVSCPSRTVRIHTTSDWTSKLLARSHSMPGYLDDFGSSMEFALDPKTKCATALVIGAAENDFAFDEGYAEVYPLDERPMIQLASTRQEGLDACALDDIDGDGVADFVYVGVKTMTLTLVSGRKGEAIRTISLLQKPTENPR